MCRDYSAVFPTKPQRCKLVFALTLLQPPGLCTKRKLLLCYKPRTPIESDSSLSAPTFYQCEFCSGLIQLTGYSRILNSSSPVPAQGTLSYLVLALSPVLCLTRQDCGACVTQASKTPRVSRCRCYPKTCIAASARSSELRGRCHPVVRR
jgi:hypothetical protein